MVDMEKPKREMLRWQILVTINAGRPLPVNEQLLLGVIGQIPLQTTPLEIRRELDYLEARGLVTVEGKRTPMWSADLTRDGIDVVEYTVECDPGIARPEKYWV